MCTPPNVWWTPEVCDGVMGAGCEFGPADSSTNVTFKLCPANINLGAYLN